MSETRKANKFMQLFEAHEEYLKKFIYSRVRNPEDSKDIFQECLSAAFAAFDDLRDKKSFAPWINKIAYNLICKKFKKTKFTETSFDEIYEANPNANIFKDGKNNIEEIILIEDDKKDARDFIGRLSYRERVFFYFYYDEERTIEEIAKILDTKVGTLWSTHSRLKDKFRRKEGRYESGRRKKDDEKNL